MAATRTVALSASITAFVLAVVFVWLRPTGWAWGFNHLAYLPGPAAELLLLVTAVLLLLCLRASRTEAVVRRIESAFPDDAKNVFHFAAALAFVLLCGAMRSATMLWGDGMVTVKVAEGAVAQNSWADAFRLVVGENRFGPGVATVHMIVARLAANFGIDPADAIPWWHALLGGAYVFVTLRLITALKIPPLARAWLAMLLWTSGAVQLFFGYVEDYTLMYLLATIVALASHACLDGRSSVAVVLAATLTCLLLHILGVLLLPGVVFLGIALRVRDTAVARRITILVTATTVVAAVVLGFVPGVSEHYRPLFGGWEARAVFSAHFLADLVNLLMLLLPWLPFVVVLAIVGSDTRRSHSGAAAVHAQLAAASLLPFVIYLVFFRPDLGLVRDWDLFALIAPFAAVFAMSVVTPDEKALHRFAAPVLVLCVLMTGGWIGLNRSAGAVEKRFRDMLVHDDSYEGYACEALAMHLVKQGHRDEDVLDLYRRGFRAEGNPRYAFSAGVLASELGHLDEAVAMMKECLRIQPDNDKARANLAAYLVQRRDYDAVIEVANEGLKTAPNDPYYNFFLGMALFETRRYDDARAQLERCLGLDLSDGMRADVTKALRFIGGIETKK